MSGRVLRRLAAVLAVAALAAVLASRAALAQDEASAPPDEASRDQVGEYVVRPGDTLESITERYLGTPALWPENWKLNPEIRNPDLLTPGQRIRVILEREVPARHARIDKIANVVHKNLQRQAEWLAASDGDLLQPLDGVRTREQSSVELEFDDASNLKLTELSQVFLKEISTSLTGVRREAIEVVRGQAELALQAARPERVEVEIVVGSATARPRVGPSGRALTRTRKPEDGSSQVMVYGGSSQVEAGGRAVEVARGMGTTVPENGAPAPPEKLLPAPGTITPERRSRWGFANPRFAWRPVAGAVSYTVEVCRDAECGQLVARAVGVGDTAWQGRPLPSGELFWRVTAVSVSGLDGFPSKAVPFAISGDADHGPPGVVAIRVGPGHLTADGTLVLGAGATVRLEAHDDAAGVAEVRYRWDGGAWQTWRGRDLEPPEGASEHTLDFQATDGVGKASPVWSVSVRRDAEGPEAPQAVRVEGL